MPHENDGYVPTASDGVGDRRGRNGRSEVDATDPARTALANTLLDALYPGIRVATVEIPGAELDDYGRAKVEQALARFTVGGVEYRLIGASGSAKSGRYYAVSKEYERPIAERFQQCRKQPSPISGILVSPCKVRIEEADAKVLVVEDHSLGTNDCRG